MRRLAWNRIETRGKRHQLSARLGRTILRQKTKSMTDLKNRIETFFSTSTTDQSAALAAFQELRDSLEAGRLRAAEPDSAAPTGWRVNAWVKQGILLGFRLGQMTGTDGGSSPAEGLTMGAGVFGAAGVPHTGGFSFIDKHTYPARRFEVDDGVRVVPGGSSVRSGAYVARGVVCMPPMYVNVGA